MFMLFWRATQPPRIDRVMPVFKSQSRAVLTLLCAAALGGCASTSLESGGPRTSILIDSEPQGASVRITGKLIGVTPVNANIDSVFPKHWTSKVETDDEGFAFFRRMETVEVSKDGCDLFSKRFMEADLKADVKVTLRCDPNYRAPAAENSAEQRLRTLDELRSKGLISDDEFRDQRQRILNSL